MSIDYEWCFEEMTFEDVTNVYFCKTLREAEKWKAGMTGKICLVRFVFDKEGDLQDRQYAYLDDKGHLPEAFDGGDSIPKRFRKEAGE